MKNIILNFLTIGLTAVALTGAHAQDITITKTSQIPGQVKPVLIALDGFSGEAAAVLNFDLYVQGFKVVTPDAAQYLIHGSGVGNVTGTVTDKVTKRVLLARSYNGASLRCQAHAFADDIVQETQNRKGIGQTKIAFKSQSASGAGEIFVADFDGYDAKPVTTDSAIVARPAWVPGKLALYYTSYARSNPDIFYHSLSSGQRRVVAGYSGLNTSASVSADGSKIAMVLSKAGSPNIWVCNTDGSNLKRLTTGVEDSSPCWSPDGQWICFATKIASRRRLAKVSVNGGAVQPLNTAGVLNPTEPDWSPDGKWIAFTRQAGNFDICVMSADGTVPPMVLVAGQNPSWAPNSRTLVYNREIGHRQVLSVLDVFTKQYKDCARTAGSNSQPAWAR
jgi:TolB protein